ncbi:MAG: 4a-hydroxytetrahydrobiopterin dehydratase, partial [Candidatus Micrarchaeota archaeon]|nr:4a-hydroxytetrahydrobiopterin dehydratase [Candidatus Micrarchaeota archaeon]
MKFVKFSDAEVEEGLSTLDSWKYSNGKLHKEFKFETFEDAVRFIDKVAVIAASLDHHPEIYNVYNRVTLDINTHDEGGITDKDFVFARH